MKMLRSRSGVCCAAIFALIFLACLFSTLLGNGQGVLMLMLVTFPFSLVCDAASSALQDAFGLSFEASNWVDWALLGVTGHVEFHVIGYGLGSAWRGEARRRDAGPSAAR